jgi:hypothetical protein
MRFPRIAELGKDTEGWGFFLCARKDVRAHRSGAEYLDVVLQDVTGEVHAKVLQNVETLRAEFDAGERQVQGKTQTFHASSRCGSRRSAARTQSDAADGFAKPTASRPRRARSTRCGARARGPHASAAPARARCHGNVARTAIASGSGWPRRSITPIAAPARARARDHGDRRFLADRYGARKDPPIAALLHDIGKKTAHYDVATGGLEGN